MIAVERLVLMLVLSSIGCYSLEVSLQQVGSGKWLGLLAEQRASREESEEKGEDPSLDRGTTYVKYRYNLPMSGFRKLIDLQPVQRPLPAAK